MLSCETQWWMYLQHVRVPCASTLMFLTAHSSVPSPLLYQHLSFLSHIHTHIEIQRIGLWVGSQTTRSMTWYSRSKSVNSPKKKSGCFFLLLLLLLRWGPILLLTTILWTTCIVAQRFWLTCYQLFMILLIQSLFWSD